MEIKLAGAVTSDNTAGSVRQDQMDSVNDVEKISYQSQCA